MEPEALKHDTPLGIYVQFRPLYDGAIVITCLNNGVYYRYAILVMIKGGAAVYFSDTILTMEASQACFFTEDCVIGLQNKIPASFWLAQFTEEFAQANIYSTNLGFFQNSFKEPYCVITIDAFTTKVLKKMFQLLQKHRTQRTSINSRVVTQISFNLLFSCLSEQAYINPGANIRSIPYKEGIAIKFISLVGERATEHHDVAYYASQLFMTSGNLTRIVKEVTGRTPKSIIEEILIRAATELLDHSIESIYLIAEELHFKCSSAFINFFRIHTGRTPNDYRNRNKE